MKIELSGDEIVLKAPANASTTVRKIPGARHDAKRQLWVLPLSWATCVIARGILGASLEVGPKLAEWAQRDLETRVKPNLMLRGAKILLPESVWSEAFDKVEADGS